MVQIIGIMVGSYIFTRMLAMATSSQFNVGARIFAALTILIDLYCMFLLILVGSIPTTWPGMIP